MYKLKDKVKIIAHNNPNPVSIGSIGTIIKITPEDDHFTYYIKFKPETLNANFFDNESNARWFNKKELELFESFNDLNIKHKSFNLRNI